MDKITKIIVLPQDKLTKRLKDVGEGGNEEILITEDTLYTANVDGLRKLVRAVAGKSESKKVIVDIRDSDATVPIVKGINIQVTKNGVPHQEALVTAESPSPSDYTDQEGAAGCDYGQIGRDCRITPIDTGTIPKHSDFVTRFSPLNMSYS